MSKATEQRLGILTRALMVVALLSVLVAAGDWTASAYQGAQVNEITAAIERSHTAFLAQVKTSIAEGTPADLLATVQAAELQTYRAAPARPRYFIDRIWLESLQARARSIQGYTRETLAVETQVEVEFNNDTLAALETIQAGLDPARAAGVDPAPWEQYVTATREALATLRIPSAAAAVATAAHGKADELAKATADQLAASQAFPGRQAGGGQRAQPGSGRPRPGADGPGPRPCRRGRQYQCPRGPPRGGRHDGRFPGGHGRPPEPGREP